MANQHLLDGWEIDLDSDCVTPTLNADASDLNKGKPAVPAKGKFNAGNKSCAGKRGRLQQKSRLLISKVAPPKSDTEDSRLDDDSEEQEEEEEKKKKRKGTAEATRGRPKRIKASVQQRQQPTTSSLGDSVNNAAQAILELQKTQHIVGTTLPQLLSSGVLHCSLADILQNARTTQQVQQDMQKAQQEAKEAQQKAATLEEENAKLVKEKKAAETKLAKANGALEKQKRALEKEVKELKKAEGALKKENAQLKEEVEASRKDRQMLDEMERLLRQRQQDNQDEEDD